MRLFRLIAFAAVLCLAVVVGAFLWYLADPGHNRMEAFATARIHRLCGWQAICKLQAGDLFEGNWDTLYAFAPGVSQSELNQILASQNISARIPAYDLQRTFVLVRGSRVVATEHADYGIETPLDGQLEFIDQYDRKQNIAEYRRDAWLRITKIPIAGGGTFYVLTPSLQ